MARPQAVRQIRQCLATGRIIPTRHFRDELANEKLDFQDALRILKTGHIYDEAEQDVKSGDWKYRCEGSVLDGKSFAIVIRFEAVDTLYLITVFSIRPKERRP